MEGANCPKPALLIFSWHVRTTSFIYSKFSHVLKQAERTPSNSENSISRKSNLLGLSTRVMEDVIHYCRKCDWSGSEPKTKTWAGTVGHQGGGAPIGGNLSVCPKCQSSVKTEEEWYRHDNPTFFDRFGGIIVLLIGLGAVTFALFAPV